MTKTNKHLAALAVVLIFAILFILLLMLRPLYLWDTDAKLMLRSLIINDEETEYDQHDYLEYDSFFVPFLKGKKLEGADPTGKYNVYRWKIEPKSSTEYLILEPTDEWINAKTQELGLTSVEDIARFKRLTIVKRWVRP